MMGVEVAQHDSVIVVEEVKQRSDVEPITTRTGGERRDVDVDDVEGRSADGDVDADDLQGVVVGRELGCVEKSVADGVMDERDEATPIIGGAVLPDDCVVTEVWVAGGER